jgi:hypothetical protein
VAHDLKPAKLGTSRQARRVQLRGGVLALVCLEVVRPVKEKGPAAVVRIIDQPAMAEAARQLVGTFGLSGFCGFDFIITDSGNPKLLELNPRVTPTAHLLVEGDYLRTGTITLFPPATVLSTQPELIAPESWMFRNAHPHWSITAIGSPHASTVWPYSHAAGGKRCAHPGTSAWSSTVSGGRFPS